MGGIAVAMVTIAMMYCKVTGLWAISDFWMVFMIVLTVCVDTAPRIGGKS